MKTKDIKQCGSSMGRIALIIRALWANFHKTTLWLGLWIVIGLVIFPRLDYIFNFNVDNLLVSEQSGTDFFVRAVWIGMLFLFTLPWFFNKFVRNSKPMTFALIPANLWEKVVALVSYFLFALIGAWGVTYLTVVIDYLLAPNVATLGMSDLTKDICSEIFMDSQHLRNFFTASLAVGSAVLTSIYFSIRYKKFFVGFGIGALVWWCVVLMFISISVNDTWLNAYLDSLDQKTIEWLALFGFAVIDTILFVLIAMKLKRIEN